MSEASETADSSSDDGAAPESEPQTDSPVQVVDRVSQLEAEGDIAADYLEELLDIADLDGDLDMDVEGDRAAVSIVGARLDVLVGDDGSVLDALQELTRLAVYRETGERSRLMLDVGGYRADLRKNLVILGQRGDRGGPSLRRGRQVEPDDALRAQGRPRCRRRGWAQERVGGCRTFTLRRDPARYLTNPPARARFT